jgi:predicted metal-dependent hydrolase
MEMHYTLHIEEKKKSSSGAKIKEDRILLSLDEKLFGVNKSEIIKTALSRVFAKKYKHEVEKRLELINKHYFGHAVKSLRLKYNKSNWGSCSNSGNINLSTRLLMAPQWVLDYVIVHELAHMNEMNHSKKYWAIVEKVYPEYKKAEKWLKAYGSTCDFVPVRTVKQLDNHKKRKA